MHQIWLNSINIILGLLIVYFAAFPKKRRIDFDKLVLKYGWDKAPSIGAMFDGAIISISNYPQHEYKTLSLSRNEVDKFYLYIRQGELDQPRELDSLVLLRNDIRTIDEVDEIYKFLTGGSFINKKRKNGKPRLSKVLRSNN